MWPPTMWMVVPQRMLHHAFIEYAMCHRRADRSAVIMKSTTQPNSSRVVTMVLLALGTVFAPIAIAQTAPIDGFYNVLSFGASPDGHAKCTEEIGKAIDAASAKGGGTVYFPAGTYLTGPIHLQSHITLRSEEH